MIAEREATTDPSFRLSSGRDTAKIFPISIVCLFLNKIGMMLMNDFGLLGRIDVQFFETWGDAWGQTWDDFSQDRNWPQRCIRVFYGIVESLHGDGVTEKGGGGISEFPNQG